MLKTLTILLTGAMLLSSCGTVSPVPPVSPKCQVPIRPNDPTIYVDEQGNMTEESLVALAMWIREMLRIDAAIDRCPNVVRMAPKVDLYPLIEVPEYKGPEHPQVQ